MLSSLYKHCDISDCGGKLLQENFSFTLFTKGILSPFWQDWKKVPAGHGRHQTAFPPCTCPLLPFFQKPGTKSCKQVTLRLTHANKPAHSYSCQITPLLCPLGGSYFFAFGQAALISSSSIPQGTAGEGCGSPCCRLSRKGCRRWVFLPFFDPRLCGSRCTALTYQGELC